MTRFIAENPNIGLIKTLSTHLNQICSLKSQQENKRFIIPYDEDQHQKVIDTKDLKHISVWEKESGDLIGFIILAGLENPNLSLEFRRIVISKNGNSFGRQCLQLIKSYCFVNLRFHRLWLDVFEDNVRAIHLYKSENFVEEGKLRDVIKKDDKFRSLLYFPC